MNQPIKKEKQQNKPAKVVKLMDQTKLFEDKIEFEYLTSVIGSGYEEQVAKLAIEDGVAYRAARKNMQIHSAIVLKINNEFSGFFTFQVNHISKEFCLLQSAMSLGKEDKEIYKQLASKFNRKTYMGKCSACREMCGANILSNISYPSKRGLVKQLSLI